MEAGRFASGCPALAESYRLDPRAGVLFTLAECEAKWGKVASALAHYDDFTQVLSRLPTDQQNRQRERLQIANAQIKALAAVVPQLTLVLPQSAPAGIVVKRDGILLGRPSLGVTLPVDPGEHVVVVEAADGGSREQRVTLAKGQKLRLELELPAPKPVDTTKPPSETTGIAPPTEPRSSGHGWTLAAFGLGAAGLATGAIAGALVLGKKGTIDTHCVDTTCDQTGLDAAHSSKTLGVVSTIGFGVGAAGIVLAFVLLATDKGASPPHAAIRPAVSPLDHGGAVGALGTW